MDASSQATAFFVSSILRTIVEETSSMFLGMSLVLQVHLVLRVKLVHKVKLDRRVHRAILVSTGYAPLVNAIHLAMTVLCGNLPVSWSIALPRTIHA